MRTLRKLLGLRVEVGRSGGHVFYTKEAVVDGERVQKRFVELDRHRYRSPQDIVDIVRDAPIDAQWHSWLLGGALPEPDADKAENPGKTREYALRDGAAASSSVSAQQTPNAPLDSINSG